MIASLPARIGGSRVKRMLLSAALGFFAWMSIDVSYWNWYEFPSSYAMAQMIDYARATGDLAFEAQLLQRAGFALPVTDSRIAAAVEVLASARRYAPQARIDGPNEA